MKVWRVAGAYFEGEANRGAARSLRLRNSSFSMNAC